MIKVSAQNWNNSFRAGQNLPFLLGCIGERVVVETEFYFEDITFATADNEIVLKPDPADVDLVDTTGVIYSEDGTAFLNMNVGDYVGIDNGGSINAYLITQKFNGGMIRTGYPGVKLILTTGVGNVFNGTPINGFRYAWNLINTGVSYNSLIDGEYQQAETGDADATVATPVDLIYKGILSYQDGGSLFLEGVGATGGTAPYRAQQSFRVTHNFIITPLFLADQYNDLIANVKPDYYKDQNCLNYISEIQIGSKLYNPNNFQTYEIENQKSNTGWFNERFNGSKNNYAITSVVVKDGATVIDALRFGKDITVDITVENTTDTPFSNGNTKWSLGFTYLPENEEDYQNNGRNFVQNFLYDTAIGTLGGSANGDNFGNSSQVIKTVSSVFNSSSSMTLTLTVNVGSVAEATIRESNDLKYMLWIITEDHTLNAYKSDKVNLLAQVSAFDQELTTTDLITAETVFITHPYTDADTPYFIDSGLEMYPVDDVAAKTDFTIDFTGLTADGITINKVKCRLILSHATEADITLEEFITDVSNFIFVDGYIQEIDFSQDRVFKIPQSIRKTISIQRNTDLDSGMIKGWSINYPYFNRWEYWVSLAINNPSSGIYDPTAPLNGLNNFWNRLANVAGWTFNYEVEFNIEQNGQEFIQTFTEPISSNDFGSGTEWSNESIKTYDSTGTDEQIAAGVKYILGYADTLVVASFEKITGLIPAEDNVEIVIWIETFEAGEIKGIRRFSSVYEDTGDTWFKSVDSSNKVKVTKAGSVFTGEALIDFSKLPNNYSYTLYARIYDQTGGCIATAILNQTGICIQDQDGIDIEVQ